MNIEEIKQFLRIDGNYDDNLLQTLKEVAEIYIENTIDDVELIRNDKRYKFAVCLLVSHYYDNRNIVTAQASNEPPYSVLAFIQQLRGVVSNGEIDR